MIVGGIDLGGRWTERQVVAVREALCRELPRLQADLVPTEITTHGDAVSWHLLRLRCRACGQTLARAEPCPRCFKVVELRLDGAALAERMVAAVAQVEEMVSIVGECRADRDGAAGSHDSAPGPAAGLRAAPRPEWLDGWSLSFSPLAELAARVAASNEAKGYDITPDNLNAKLLLVVSEVCEAQDVMRDNAPLGAWWEGEGGKPEGFPVELVDALVRLLHLLHWSLDGADETVDGLLARKLAYNETRAPRGF